MSIVAENFIDPILIVYSRLILIPELFKEYGLILWVLKGDQIRSEWSNSIKPERVYHRLDYAAERTWSPHHRMHDSLLHVHVLIFI